MTSDYCDELYGSERYFILYYKIYNQIYCSVARANNFVPEQLKFFFNIPYSERGGWIKGEALLDRKLLFEHFTPYFIFTKRIKGKNLILFN
jgi:hypothetical protein